MNSELFVSHSYVRCLRQGLAFALRKLGSILFFSWPLLLLLAAACVLLDSRFFMVYARGGEVGAVGCSALALFVLAVLMLQAIIVWQQHRLGANGSLPRRGVWREYGSVLRLFLRNLSANLVNALIAGGVGVVLWLGADKLSGIKSADVSTLGWMGIGLAGILLFMVLLGLLAFMQLFWANFLYGNQRIFDTLRVTLRGMHHLARTSALQFVQMIYSVVLLVLFCLPYSLFVVMERLATQTMAQGDAVIFPAYYPYLHYASLFFVVLGIAITFVLTLYPTLYNWCAIQSEKVAA